MSDPRPNSPPLNPPVVNGQVSGEEVPPVIVAQAVPYAFNRRQPTDRDEWIVTDFLEKSVSLSWRIRDYRTLIGSREEITSPVFRGEPYPDLNHSWALRLTPRKKIGETDFLSTHLIMIEHGEGPRSSAKLRIRFQISLLSLDGLPIKQAGGKAMKVCEFAKNRVWGFDKFWTSEEVNRLAVMENALMVHCVVWLEPNIRHMSVEGGPRNIISLDDSEVTSRSQALLAKDFKKLLADSTFADVTIRSGDKTFPAHKCILSARSPVFDSMLKAGLLEGPQMVEINDFEPVIVKLMLDHIYSGDFGAKLEGHLVGLIQIADKYELVGLMKDCEEALVKNLNIENAAQFHVLGHAHNSNYLKFWTGRFIVTNRIEVFKTPEFRRLSDGNLNLFLSLF